MADTPESNDRVADRPVDRLTQSALLTEYQELRAEIRGQQARVQRLFTRGVAAIGFVIGYALLAPGGQVFVTVVPVIIGAVFILAIANTLEMELLGRHLYDIEAAIPVGEFGWEHRYGGFLEGNQRTIQSDRWAWLDWYFVPLMAVYSLAVVVFLGIIVAALFVVDATIEGVILGMDPTVAAGIGYAVLSVMLGVVAYAYFVIHQAIQPPDESRTSRSTR